MIALFSCWIFGHEWKWIVSKYRGGNSWDKCIKCAHCGAKKPYEIAP